MRAKQEELSEMNVRKEMAEKKLSNLARDNEVAAEKLTVIDYGAVFIWNRV